MFVEGLSTESVGTQGTNFKAVMDEAKTAFDHGGIDSDENIHVSKVLLLISDGEDQEPGALEMARKVADDGMRLFTIAFGSERGAPIPIRDERGFLSGYKRERSGQNVISKVNADFLRQLAQVGRGSFHHATSGGMEAKLVKEDLDKLEKKEFASTLETNYDERFQIPLLIGFLLTLIDLLIGEKRSTGRIWKGRFEVAGQ
jgi:Ca-activated chloride channel family protein